MIRINIKRMNRWGVSIGFCQVRLGYIVNVWRGYIIGENTKRMDTVHWTDGVFQQGFARECRGILLMSGGFFDQEKYQENRQMGESLLQDWAFILQPTIYTLVRKYFTKPISRINFYGFCNVHTKHFTDVIHLDKVLVTFTCIPELFYTRQDARSPAGAMKTKR